MEILRAQRLTLQTWASYYELLNHSQHITADPDMESHTLTIRPITSADNAAMAAIIRTVMTEVQASGPGFSIHDTEVDRMYEAYATPRAAYYVVIDEAGTVLGGGGVAGLEGGDTDTCELKKMYFLPEARGRGAGRTLLARCLDAARRLGYSRCYLETLRTMDDARRLYERAGFTRVPGPLGHTGHFSCDAFYMLDLYGSQLTHDAAADPTAAPPS